MVPLRSARRRRPLTCVTDLTYCNRLHVPNITSVTGYRKACSRLHGAGGRALAMRIDTVRSFANTGGHTPSVDHAGFPQDFPADARVLDPGGAIQSALGPGDLAQFEPAPSSIRAMLRKIVFTSDRVPALDELKWFAMTGGRCRCREGASFMLTRTGCTGERSATSSSSSAHRRQGARGGCAGSPAVRRRGAGNPGRLRDPVLRAS